jgi:undecaprenyl-diphosphatase
LEVNEVTICRFIGKRVIATAAVLTILALAPSIAADLATGVINSTKPALALGLGACLLSTDNQVQGIERATRAVDAVTASVGIARLVKDKTDSSFPSGHAAAAFAMATTLSEIQPKKKWLFYAGAALVGWSLVESDSGGHDWGDVAAGAALGITVGKLQLKCGDGLLLRQTYKF